MMAGHFALAVAVKAKTPKVPIWSLLVSTQLLDILFLPLFLLGIETMEPVASNGYGGFVFHADYTHSMLGALIIALIAGVVAGRFWNRRGGMVIGSVVFSHWLLDLLVHRADMPILPGNAGDFPLLGFGLWRFSTLSIILESILIAIGTVMYFRSTLSVTEVNKKSVAVTKGVLMGVALILLLLVDVI